MEHGTFATRPRPTVVGTKAALVGVITGLGRARLPQGSRPTRGQNLIALLWAERPLVYEQGIQAVSETLGTKDVNMMPNAQPRLLWQLTRRTTRGAQNTCLKHTVQKGAIGNGATGHWPVWRAVSKCVLCPRSHCSNSRLVRTRCLEGRFYIRPEGHSLREYLLP